MNATKVILTAVLAALSTVPAFARGDKYNSGIPSDAEDGALDSAFTKVAVSMTGTANGGVDDLIDGLKMDSWKQLYLAGQRDLKLRVYDAAEAKLLDAVKASK